MYVFNKNVNNDSIFIYVLCVWILNVGNCSNTFNGHRGSIISVIQLSDNRIISGGYDHVIKIWNLEGNQINV